MIVRINIGLQRAEDLGLDYHHVAGLLKRSTESTIGKSAEVLDYRRVMSSGGDWEPEPVLWAECEIAPPTIDIGSADRVDRFKLALQSLCVALAEDSIAVAIVSPRVGHGTMIFHPYYDGEQYQFNLDYFTE